MGRDLSSDASDLRGSGFVVNGEGSPTSRPLQGEIVGEVATRCRQGGVTCHAIVGRNQLDPFGQRIIDLASITEATTLDEKSATPEWPWSTNDNIEGGLVPPFLAV